MGVDLQKDRITLHLGQTASAEILFYGASVISWKSNSPGNAEASERLFLSSKAILDGTKAVRGGIPVVFPCFGLPSHPQHMKLPQHGFARSETWKLAEIITDTAGEVSVKLTLDPTPGIISKYDRPFSLSYLVKLIENQLIAELHVTNTSSSESLEFQALLHNYIRAPASEVSIKPLSHQFYLDKTAATDEQRNTLKEETRQEVDVKTFTDSVYPDSPQDYMVTWSGDGLHIKTSNFKDLVIWNPQQEAGSKMSDMEDGGWERYVCVEPGHVRGFVNLGPGEDWVGTETLTVTGPNSTKDHL